MLAGEVTTGAPICTFPGTALPLGFDNVAPGPIVTTAVPGPDEVSTTGRPGVPRVSVPRTVRLVPAGKTMVGGVAVVLISVRSFTTMLPLSCRTEPGAQLSDRTMLLVPRFNGTVLVRSPLTFSCPRPSDRSPGVESERTGVKTPRTQSQLALHDDRRARKLERATSKINAAPRRHDHLPHADPHTAALRTSEAKLRLPSPTI